MLKRKFNLEKIEESKKGHTSTYSDRYFDRDVPKHIISQRSMLANAAYQLVHDELNLDGNPSLNLASFVNTWMEPEANQLIAENIHKNFIDHDEYPQSEIFEERCLNMLARLFNSPEEIQSLGTSTIGSSEAILLGLLAHKWRWKNRRQVKNKSFDNPNIVMGADVHVVWEKFAKYFDVEARIIPMEPNQYTVTAEKVASLIDENTICVGAVLGTTFTGEYDPIEEINKLLLETKKNKGLDIPIHVDAASGGFIAPFLYPELKWDFRLEQVKSINVSGHKYGLVYPGLGWLIFRDKNDLPENLIFYVNYLGGQMPTFTLNFSQGSSMVLAQYYNFLRLGKEGYTEIATNVTNNAIYIANRLINTGKFDLLTDKIKFPVVTVKLKKPSNLSVFDISHRFRERG